VEPDVVQRLADPRRRDHGLRLDLEQRAARELDAVVETAGGQESHADEHDGTGDHVGPAGPLDEIVFRVREESDHQTLKVVMAGRRCSQMRKKVFTTKIAETIEAAIPMIKVIAKPFTGPVPTRYR